MWMLGEGSGTREDAWRDNDLTPSNAPTNEAGVVGSAATFVYDSGLSSGQSLFRTDTTGDLATGALPFTFAAWVKLGSKASKAKAGGSAGC